MHLHYIKQNKLEELEGNIESNIEKYKSCEIWLDSFFEDEWKIPITYDISNLELIVSKEAKYDCENSIILFSALQSLNSTQASDARLWAYLTHVTFWEYMRTRWDIERVNKNIAKVIKDRYFLGSSKLSSNGISRLWWFAYSTYDPNREDPFELTKILFTTQDLAWGLMNRSYARNKHILHTILETLSEHPNFLKKEENSRKLFKNINREGGLTIIDSLSKEDIRTLIVENINSIQKPFNLNGLFKKK